MRVTAHEQRQALCDMLAGLTVDQWTAETLCAGWDAGDIAAHLIAREREPWAAPGILLGGPFAEYTDGRRRAWKKRGRESLIATLRSGPPWPLTTGPLEGSQIVEDWIHDQDVRRGGANLPDSTLDHRVEGLLWQAATRFAKRTLAVGADMVIELTDGSRRQRLQSRRLVPVALPTDSAPDVVVSGAAPELLLYVVGRAKADVDLTGDPVAVERLTSTERGV